MVATVREADLAKAFLSELGAKDTPLMEKAVVAWMRHESGSRIIGNNPFNLRPSAAAASGIKTCGSRTSVSSGQFAVFCSPTDGARAAAGLLKSAGHDWRGYDRVVAAARKGDPIKFLDALARSAWSGSRYGGPKNNGLLKTYASITGLSTVDLQAAASSLYDSNPVTSTKGGGATEGKPTVSKNVTGTESGGTLGAWGDSVVFPVGHVLTAADVQYIMATLSSRGFFTGDVGGVAQSITESVLNSKIGQPWNQSLLGSIQSALFTSANEAVPKTPLDPLFAVAGSVAQVVAALFDPYKWLLILSLIAGVALTAYGGVSIARAAA